MNRPGSDDALAMLKGWSFLMPELLNKSNRLDQKFERVHALLLLL